jgi:hypothetical protein
MRVIIGGSRSISDPEALEAAVSIAGFEISSVITGNSSGADALAGHWARERGLPLEVVAVEWSRYGGRAERIRNELALSMADASIMLWDGFSRGTAVFIEMASMRNLDLVVYECNPQQATSRESTRIHRRLRA